MGSFRCMWRRIPENRVPFAIKGRLFSSRAVELKVANPQALLNAIASSYKSMPRILMEYVDNAIDAGEERRKEDESFNLRIAVDIDSHQRNIWIRDNGPGMDENGLRNVVGGVGDSKKRSVPWLNGQFGFGVHAFRAAASELVIYSSKEDSRCKLMLDRDSISGEIDTFIEEEDDLIRDARERGLFLSTDNSLFPSQLCGTAAVLLNVDPVWFDSSKVKSVAVEIENHFEGKLYEGKTHITVSRIAAHPQHHSRGNKGDHPVKRSAIVCTPFDYGSVENGVTFNRTISIDDKDPSLQIHCDLVVSNQVKLNKPARFFCKGRCINTVSETRSFMDGSEFKARLWDHPGVAGRIDVTGVLEPVLTRDEFKRTATRAKAFEALRPLEKEVQQALDELIAASADESMREIENLLSQALSQAFKEPPNPVEQEKAEVQNETKVEEAPDNVDAVQESIEVEEIAYKPITRETTTRTKRNKSNFKPGVYGEVRFVRVESDESGSAKRSFRVADCVYINVEHEDFRSRLEMDRQGQIVIGRRVASYLANEIATCSQDLVYEKQGREPPSNRLELYEDLVSSSNLLESVLQSRLSAKLPKEAL